MKRRRSWSQLAVPGRAHGISRRGFLGRAGLTALGALRAIGPARTRASAAEPQGLVQVTVDFGAPIPDVPSMSGILHGMSTTDPPDQVIAPLRPNLWRVGNEPSPLGGLYDRVVGFGARFELVLSDTWGYHSPWPYESYPNWEAHVGRVASASQGKDVLWDVWNEPNISAFWQGTRDQFFETYRRAYGVLRDQLGPDAWIGGPSITQYDHDFLAAFLDFCAANACEVNFLSWHELRSAGARIYPIAANLADARASFVDNPDYAALNIEEIHVNEIIGSSDQYRPGEIWGTFYYLEQGGADGACKACWPASDLTSNCSNDTLDGLVSPQTARPRAGWWAYKLYAHGVESRVSSTTSNQQVAPLASAQSPDTGAAQVLVGYFEGPNSPPSVDIDLVLQNLNALPFLKSADCFLARLEGLPDSGEAELPRPIGLDRAVFPIADDGSACIPLPSLALHEGFRLSIRRAEGGRAPHRPPPRRRRSRPEAPGMSSGSPE